MVSRKAAPVVDADERQYPAIEVFLETRDREEVGPSFASTRTALSELPKAKADVAKRAIAALDRTETLLGMLFDQKEQLQREAKNPRKARR
jgi:hypothetical protein